MTINLPILLIQLGIFLYVLFALNFFFFRPIMGILRKRDEMTVGRSDAAEDFRRQIQEFEEKIEAEVTKTKSSLDEHRQETLKHHRDLSEKKISEAKERIEKQVGEKRTVLEKEVESMRSRIPQMSEAVSREIISAVTTAKVVRL